MAERIPPLETDEILRIMDAARVIHERQERLDAHEAFDRDAAIREIQTIYEDVGELVDEEAIGRALDEYLGERHTFDPADPGPRRALATFYVRRGRIARTVLLPAAAAVLLLWSGQAAWSALQQNALDRRARAAAGEVASALAEREGRLGEIERMLAGPTHGTLPAEDRRAVRAHLSEAVDHLATLADVDAAPSRLPEDVSEEELREWESRAARAELAVRRADVAVAEAAAILDRRRRFTELREELGRLEDAVPAVAVEDSVARAAAALADDAVRYVQAGDVEGLATVVQRLRDLETVLLQEYRVVTTGGVWRHPDDDPDVRNHYLTVRAVDADGEPVRVTVVNEETGGSEVVSEWAERVPEEVYDRVRADKEDNGLIDDELFGVKRRGHLGMDREHPDLGQITRW